MKNLSAIFLIIFFVSCDKDNTGKHCPVLKNFLSEQPAADLTPVKNVQPIMDTLAKYPELKVFNAQFSHHLGSGYFAHIACYTSYKGLRVGETYLLNVHENFTITAHGDPRPELNLSASPTFSREDAIKKAETLADYQTCASTDLIFRMMTIGNTKGYRLCWMIRPAEASSPFVELDAHTGEVYNVSPDLTSNHYRDR